MKLLNIDCGSVLFKDSQASPHPRKVNDLFIGLSHIELDFNKFHSHIPVSKPESF